MNRTHRNINTDRTGLEDAANRIGWATVAIICIVLWVTL